MENKNLLFTETNRSVNRNHVEKLKESIRKHGFMKEFPIIINEDGEIIDGQHRYVAARELGIDFPISIVKNCDDIMLDINTTQKQWSLTNYVNYYAKIGREDFQKIQAFSKNYCASVSEAILILLNKPTGGSCLKKIKLGGTSDIDFSTTGIQKSVHRALYINEVIKRLNLGRLNKIVNAILIMMRVDGFNKDVLLSKLSIQKDKIGKCVTTQGYLKMFEDIYNYHNTSKLVFLQQGR